MATTPDHLFSWQAVESSPEILRFELVLEQFDDEPLLRALEAERGLRGRDDYPLRAVWNSYLAGLVFKHDSLGSLIAELQRNGELRQACGFDPLLGADAVPTRFVYMRLVKKLLKHKALLKEIFGGLVRRAAELLPDLGQFLAADGKAIRALGKHDRKAATGTKREATEEGEVLFHWHGYKLHMLCDATHELPLSFRLTPASEADTTHLLPLVEQLAKDNPNVLARAEELSADRGYDCGEDKRALWEDYGIAPLIPARDVWQGEAKPLDEKNHDTIYVMPRGEVCCKIRPFAGRDEEKFCAMQFQGFEAERGALKFRCPAAAFGVECQNQAACRSQTKDNGFGRVVRVPLDRDRRLHLPVYAASGRFEKAYKKRTSVERLFSRIDHMFGFERPPVLGEERMELRLTIALSAMLAIAIGWIELGQEENIRRIRAA